MKAGITFKRTGERAQSFYFNNVAKRANTKSGHINKEIGRDIPLV